MSAVSAAQTENERWFERCRNALSDADLYPGFAAAYSANKDVTKWKTLYERFIDAPEVMSERLLAVKKMVRHRFTVSAVLNWSKVAQVVPDVIVTSQTSAANSVQITMKKVCHSLLFPYKECTFETLTKTNGDVIEQTKMTGYLQANATTFSDSRAALVKPFVFLKLAFYGSKSVMIMRKERDLFVYHLDEVSGIMAMREVTSATHAPLLRACIFQNTLIHTTENGIGMWDLTTKGKVPTKGTTGATLALQVLDHSIFAASKNELSKWDKSGTLTIVTRLSSTTVVDLAGVGNTLLCLISDGYLLFEASTLTLKHKCSSLNVTPLSCHIGALANEIAVLTEKELIVDKLVLEEAKSDK